MPYVTLQQLTDRYSERMLVQLTDRGVPGVGLIDAAVVSRALDDTDALIDGYLAGRYSLPLDTVPPLLTGIAAEIAIHKLHQKSPNEKIQGDYDSAMKRLSEIAKGIITLQVAGAEPAPSSSSNTVRTNEPERPFTNDTLKGFI